MGKERCNGEGHLFGNCNPKGCIPRFKFCNVISEAYVFICPGFAIKQSVAFSAVLDMVIMNL